METRITVVGTIGTERRLTAKDAISLTVGTDVELTAENSITDTQQIKEFDETCLDPGSVESISGEAVCIDDSAKDARFTFDVEVTPGLNQKQEYWYQFESDDFSQPECWRREGVCEWSGTESIREEGIF